MKYAFKMKKQLQKAIDLAAYTGDKIIVVDENNDRGTVLMSLDEYERMVVGENKIKSFEDDLTDDEWLDKINREITLGDSASEDESENEEVARIEDDFLTSEKDSEPIDDVADIPSFETSADSAGAVEEEESPETDENLYYYEEPPLAQATETKDEEVEDSAKEDKAFTSVGEELKNRHNWEIPKNIKNGAQEVK